MALKVSIIDSYILASLEMCYTNWTYYILYLHNVTRNNFFLIGKFQGHIYVCTVLFFMIVTVMSLLIKKNWVCILFGVYQSPGIFMNRIFIFSCISSVYLLYLVNFKWSSASVCFCYFYFIFFIHVIESVFSENHQELQVINLLFRYN